MNNPPISTQQATDFLKELYCLVQTQEQTIDRLQGEIEKLQRNHYDGMNSTRWRMK